MLQKGSTEGRRDSRGHAATVSGFGGWRIRERNGDVSFTLEKLGGGSSNKCKGRGLRVVSCFHERRVGLEKKRENSEKVVWG